MAEQIPRGPGPQREANQQDDVLGKIDQLLNRGRPKASGVEAIPPLAESPGGKNVPIGEAVPTLMDVVTGPGRAAKPPPALSRPGVIRGELILQRMAIALDAEHIRLLAQIDRNDAAQARMLDRLVGELKRALPGVIRAALAGNNSAASQPDDDRRL